MLLALILAFTTPSAPPRHPTPPGDVGKTYIYVFDPYTAGASSGIVSEVPKEVNCGANGIAVYDDGGSVGVICVSGATDTNTVTIPATPAVNTTTTYFFALDAGWPAIPATIAADGLSTPTGIMWGFEYLSSTMKWDLQCAYPVGWSLATFVQVNQETPSVTGSTSGVAWSSATLLDRLKRMRTLSGSSLNSTANVAQQAGRESVWRGNTAGAGGWLSWQRFHIDDIKADGRVFIGWLDTTSTWTGEPNALTNTIYVGCNEGDGDANLDICSNDNVTTATCTTLGSGYPCKTDNVFYDLWIYVPPNGSYINWYIENLTTPANKSGQLTTDLPQNTVQLNWQMGLNTGATTTTQVRFGFMGMCSLGNL